MHISLDLLLYLHFLHLGLLHEPLMDMPLPPLLRSLIVLLGPALIGLKQALPSLPLSLTLMDHPALDILSDLLLKEDSLGGHPLNQPPVLVKSNDIPIVSLLLLPLGQLHQYLQ